MPYTEPTHDTSARTTATSKAEGRLIVGVSRKMKNKMARKYLKKKRCYHKN